MRHTKFALALLTASMLAACGDPSGGDQTLKTKFSSQVSFGDSLSDVGTYNVGTIKAAGGGAYTINGDNTARSPVMTGKNWTDLMAAQFGLPAQCPAQTGLDGDASKGFAVPVVNHANCYSYAQGGARVTNPIGPGHKLTGSPVGQLTVPVVTQIANHLAKTGGKFSGTEVVFVMAGGNDALSLLGELAAAATAVGQKAGADEGAKVGADVFASTLVGLLAKGATNPATAAAAIGLALQTEAARPGHTNETVVGAAVAAAASQAGNAAVASPAVYGPLVAEAQATGNKAGLDAGAVAGAKAGAVYLAANGPAAVAAMSTLGTELAALVKTQIVGKGANYVVVNNMPDIGISPSAKKQDAATQQLINAMVSAFNTQLKSGLAGEAKVLYVDLFSVSHDQAINPAPYGLTNTTTPACGSNALGGTSLICNGSNVISGDVSHYMFADDIHPTPFEHSLIAKYVAEQMIVKGWL